MLNVKYKHFIYKGPLGGLQSNYVGLVSKTRP